MKQNNCGNIYFLSFITFFIISAVFAWVTISYPKKETDMLTGIQYDKFNRYYISISLVTLVLSVSFFIYYADRHHKCAFERRRVYKDDTAAIDVLQVGLLRGW